MNEEQLARDALGGLTAPNCSQIVAAHLTMEIQQSAGEPNLASIPGGEKEALDILARYPCISSAIDIDRFTRAIRKKYPKGPEIEDGEVWDLYTALLVSVYDGFKQEGNNQATPEGVLFSLDQAVRKLSLGPEAAKSLGNKLCNLRTSSLWDTLSELLLATRLVGAGCEIVVEYPLDPNAQPGRGKDADVAVIQPSGRPILIDAVAPQRIDTVGSVRAQIAEWIARKYDTKFKDHCERNPDSRVAVVVSLLKNELFYLGFLPKLLEGGASRLDSPALESRSGLVLAHACSFRCVEGRQLVLDPIATYVRAAGT